MRIKNDTTIDNSLGINGATGSSAYPLRVETDSNKQIGIGEQEDVSTSFTDAHATGGGATVFFSRNNGDMVSAIGTFDTGTTGLVSNMFFSSRNDFYWAGGDSINAATQRMKLSASDSEGLDLFSTSSTDYQAFSVQRSNGLRVFEGGLGRDDSGYLRVSNGSNYGLLVQGLANTPIIGAYTGGKIQFKGVSNQTRGGLTFEATSLMKLDFANDVIEMDGDLNVKDGTLYLDSDTANLTSNRRIRFTENFSGTAG